MSERRRAPLQLTEIVEAGLCIGCGLCASVAGPDRVRMVMTAEGRERPRDAVALDEATLERINEVCPGTQITGAVAERLAETTRVDPIWGPVARAELGYAGDPRVRHEGSSGGVLTALGQYLLTRGDVDFVLHVAASRSRPMRSERRVSFDAAQVLEGAGSRYGPAAPLVDLGRLLDDGRRFAFIGKPCDVNALRNLARHDPRVDELMPYALAMVCGGASELGKSAEVLADRSVSEDELTLFRYRGFGNPGPTRIETRAGRSFELAYGEMWAEEEGWRIQSRCKVCPDAIGEGADLVAMDCWPNGVPTGDDDGFNAIVARTGQGERLLADAARDGALVLDRPLDVRELDVFQPHQVAKKRAVWARLVGRRAAGLPVPQVRGLRIRELARANPPALNLAEARGSRERARAGRVGEAPVEEERTRLPRDGTPGGSGPMTYQLRPSS